MTTIDIIILILLGAGAITGFMKGFIKQLGMMMSMVVIFFILYWGDATGNRQGGTSETRIMRIHGFGVLENLCNPRNPRLSHILVAKP